MNKWLIPVLALALAGTALAQDPVPTPAAPAPVEASPAPAATPPAEAANAQVGQIDGVLQVDPAKGPPVNEQDAVARRLMRKYPRLTQVTVQPVVAGNDKLYEFQAGGVTGYTNANIDWILTGGELLSTDSATSATINITKKRAAEAGQRLFSSFPLNAAIKIVYGKGERPLLVFADPDCPYCHELDLAMQTKGAEFNATVYIMTYPLDMHPQAKRRAQHLWCTANPAQAWTAWMKAASGTGNGLDAAWAGFVQNYPAPATCPAAVNVETAQRVGRTLGVSTTPTVVFENGVATEGTDMTEIEQGFIYVKQAIGPYRTPPPTAPAASQ